jgi:hypothetical protein
MSMKRLSRKETRRIAANIAKLPDPLRKRRRRGTALTASHAGE